MLSKLEPDEERLDSVYLRNDDIIVITEGVWNSSKRMRHKMAQAWARQGNRVLWIEQSPFPVKGWVKGGQGIRAVKGDLRQVEERLWVGAMPLAFPGMYKGGRVGNTLKAVQRPWYLKRLYRYIKELHFSPRIVFLMQQAARHDVLESITAPIKIYYSYDLYGYGGATAASWKELETCCRTVDMTWSTSEAQRRLLSPFNPNTYHFPHAIDLEWWERNCEQLPPEYESIPSPRAVYTGVFQKKVSLSLLVEVATARPQWSFVFVGAEGGNMDQALLTKLKQKKNVHFLGHRNPDSLPGFIAGAEMLMLPYKTDWENAKFAGLALKFYEYLISGNPILTTPYADFETNNKELLFIRQTPREWIEVLDGLRALDSSDLRCRRQELARQNGYEQRIEAQREVLEKWERSK